MAKLKINGQSVTVDDSFLHLSPDEQNATVDEIAKSLSQRQGSTGSGVPAAPTAADEQDKYSKAAQDEIASIRSHGVEPSTGLAGKFTRGVTLGAGTDILAGLETPVEMLRHGTFNPVEGFKYSKAYQRAINEEGDKKTGLAGDIVEGIGGMSSAGNLARNGYTFIKEGQKFIPRVLSMGKEGAAYGAATGALGGGDTAQERFDAAKSGAGLGFGLGAGLPVVARVGQIAAAPITSNIMARVDPAGAAGARLARALSESGKTPEQVAQSVADADAAGQGVYTLADAMGNPGQRLLSTVGRAPGEGRTHVVEYLNNRQAGQADRVGNIVDEALGADATARQESAARMAKANADAGPLYKQAFEGGSIAPLEHQFQVSHAEAVNATSQAEKQLAAARQAQLLAKAKLSNAGENVYGVNSANSAGSEADAAVAAAEKQLGEAKKGESDILERLRQAQADGSANAPGAVWNPRIQQFLNDPIIKEGIRKGLTVQRLEALAKGEKFDPTEFAVTGADEAGNPIVGKVPNMRLLDAAKRGLDHILEAYRDPMTGRVNLDQYGRAVDQVRKAFLGELDNINQTYKSARSAYAEPASQAEAIGLGQRAASRGRASDNINTFNRLGEGQKQGFREGYADTLNSGIERGAEGVNAARRFTSGKSKDEIGALSLHQGPMRHNEANEAQKRLGRELEMFETRRQATGGSQTAENLADASDQQIDPRAVWNLLHGNFAHAGIQFAHGAKNALGGNTAQVRAELAKLLLRNGGSNDIESVLLGHNASVAKRQALVNELGRQWSVGTTIGARSEYSQNK
jgi:hypothetical protein